MRRRPSHTYSSNPSSCAAVDANAEAGDAGFKNEDEYEYEYDENDAEDLYFAIDLTTHVPGALVDKKAAESNAPPAVNGDAVHGALDFTAEDAGEGPQVSARTLETAGFLQIIDLQAKNPLVKLDDDVYTCQWTTDLGTQLYITESGVIAKPRRPGTILDIVGTSRARLVGRPVKLKPRASIKTPTSLSTPSSLVTIDDDFIEADIVGPEQIERTESSPGLQVAPGQQLKIPRDLCQNTTALAQATFLERLSEIKIKRGENDVVPIQGVRMYDPPENAEELKQTALDADAEEAKKTEDERRAVTDQRPRKRRRCYTSTGKGFASREAGLAVPIGRQSHEFTKARLGLSLENGPPEEPNALDPMPN